MFGCLLKLSEKFGASNWDRLNSFISTKRAFKKPCVFYLETFGIMLSSITSRKIKQHLAMLAIQIQKALWHKKRQKQSQDHQPCQDC